MREEETIDLPDLAAWERWLEQHHADRSGVWLRIAKKGSTATSVTSSDALDGALCFGWIDGQRRRLDDDHFLQRYCPRRPKSTWSQVNVAKVEALAAAGRMREAGLAQVAAAQADGRWDAAYERQGTATPPPDLVAALEEDHAAQASFAALGRSERYAILLRLMTARTPEERARRLTQEVGKLARGSDVDRRAARR